MSVTRIFNPAQKSFFEMLNQFPRIAIHWNQQHLELNINSLEKDLNVMSSGERAIARFLGGVWLSENKFNFDMISHVKDFGVKENQIFASWVNDPFYP